MWSCLRALALAGTGLDGIYGNAEYFIFGLGCGAPSRKITACSELDWWITLVSCLRCSFSRLFILPKEMNGLMDG